MHDAPTEHPNKGRPPRDQSVALGIRFANGKLARHEYTAGQLRWSLTGDEWDVAFFWRA